MRVADWTLEDLILLYSEVMRLQDVVVPSATKDEIAALVSVEADGMGEVIAFHDTESVELASMVLLLQDKGLRTWC